MSIAEEAQMVLYELLLKKGNLTWLGHSGGCKKWKLLLIPRINGQPKRTSGARLGNSLIN